MSTNTINPDVKFEEWDDNLQRLFHCIRKIGIDCMKKILAIYFTINDPIIFQQELKNALSSKKRNALFPDQQKILFGGVGTDINELDSTLIMKILYTTKDSHLLDLEKLQDIRNWIMHYGTKPLSRKDFEKKFSEQRRLLMKLDAKPNDIDYWKTATTDCKQAERLAIMYEIFQIVREGK